MNSQNGSGISHAGRVVRSAVDKNRPVHSGNDNCLHYYKTEWKATDAKGTSAYEIFFIYIEYSPIFQFT